MQGWNNAIDIILAGRSVHFIEDYERAPIYKRLKDRLPLRDKELTHFF